MAEKLKLYRFEEGYNDAREFIAEFGYSHNRNLVRVERQVKYSELQPAEISWASGRTEHLSQAYDYAQLFGKLGTLLLMLDVGWDPRDALIELGFAPR